MIIVTCIFLLFKNVFVRILFALISVCKRTKERIANNLIASFEFDNKKKRENIFNELKMFPSFVVVVLFQNTLMLWPVVKRI